MDMKAQKQSSSERKWNR